MPCLVNPVKTEQCVYVTYEGRIPVLEIMVTRRVVHRYVAMKHWAEIIVNITHLQITPTATELMDLAKDSSFDCPRHVRVALIIRPDQARYVRLMRSMSSKSIVMEYFLDAKEAKAWVTGVTTATSPGHTPHS